MCSLHYHIDDEGTKSFTQLNRIWLKINCLLSYIINNWIGTSAGGPDKALSIDLKEGKATAQLRDDGSGPVGF